MNYKVESLKDETYQVYKYPDDVEHREFDVVFQGSLSECEAYISLDKQGYL